MLSERQRIHLDVIRDGKCLLGSSSRSDMHSISISFDDSVDEVVVGRLDLLPAQHRSCGCDERTNAGSTRGKCNDCSAVNAWAASNLSRRLLRFTRDMDNGIFFVQARGANASVRLGSKILTFQKHDWGEKVAVQKGDVLAMGPTKQVGKKLELRVQIDAQDHEEALGMSSTLVVSSSSQSTATESQIQSQSYHDSLLPNNNSRPASSTATLVHSNAVRRSKPPEQNKWVDNPVITKHRKKPLSSIFLVPLGHDMSSVRRKFLANRARKLGIGVVDSVLDATHVVISQQVSTLSEVCTALQNVSEKKLRTYIEQNDIPCVLPDWIAFSHGDGVRDVGVVDQWHGDLRKRPKDDCDKGNSASHRVSLGRNAQLAEVFRQLSSLHQSCPLLASDKWKAYMFRIIAGRLTHLDFEISDDPEIMSRLRKISGFGGKSVDKIQEYLETGAISRIQEFESDPQRVAMKNMMNIWGVGRKTALDLIHRGFRDVNDVRSAISQGQHFLDRNQLVGVDCYEDILEEMTRDEVQAIGNIVEDAVHELFPDAEVQIMGSFRRGKATCGDIDVHITDKSFVKKIPERGLSKIVDLLWERGNLAFHLTFLPGMHTGCKVSDYMKSSRHIPYEAWKESQAGGYLTSRGHNGSSYMGVFRSPCVDGKRRRIDIKFYAWRERIFASLYFTGNGYFNRSMRLWATRRFRYTLNDRGLFFTGTQDRVMEANSELEVFEKLKLVYKEPHMRESFDAVVGKEGSINLELTLTEFQEDKNHIWVE